MRTWLCLFFLFSITSPTWAQQDLMSELVVKKNPRTPWAFLQLLQETGKDVQLHTVANRGACNPARGSFSVFGDIGRELTFGVFVEPDEQGVLTLQEDFKTRLLVEVISLDRETGLKNFWELIGDGEGSAWHYRGNSLDILADIEEINMGTKSDFQFGRRLRCSGCHTGGDLVMKELFPYNDWRVNKPLDTGPYTLSPKVEQMFSGARSAHHLRTLVDESLALYVKSLEKHSPESTAQWTRSVLAPLEMNLASDTVSFQERRESETSVEIPAAFFVDPLLTGPQTPVKVPLAVYERALRELGAAFAPDETPGLSETQHAFLIPVRSRFDQFRIDSLLSRGLLDRETLLALLAVDFRRPIYSPRRLKLMESLPDSWSTPKELQNHFLRVLQGSPEGSPGAELLSNLKQADDFHQARAIRYLEEMRKHADQLEHVKDWLRNANQSRHDIQRAQTSTNPRGAILEGGLGADGFRRIFPTLKDPEG